MTRQWKRQAEVIVGAGGSGLSIKDLRVQFEVIKTADKEPNKANIKIYNLNPDNEARVKEEFDEVLVNAGYLDAVGLIFRGNIMHVYRYKEGPDMVIEIEASDGDKDFRKAIVNRSFAAGSTNTDVLEQCLASFEGVGNTIEGTILMPERSYLRGKVVAGATRKTLDFLAREAGANWSIQDGELTMVGVLETLPDEVQVINKDTGMIGSPEVNEKGVTVRCLLNNKLKVNGQIELDMASINERPTSPMANDPQPGVERKPATGLFKILTIKHTGDNRGTDWISEVGCVLLD